jgi:hypothetical protein
MNRTCFLRAGLGALAFHAAITSAVFAADTSSAASSPKAALFRYELPTQMFGYPCASFDEVERVDVYCSATDKNEIRFSHIGVQDSNHGSVDENFQRIEMALKYGIDSFGNPVLIDSEKSSLSDLSGSILYKKTYRTDINYVTDWILIYQNQVIYARIGTSNSPKIDQIEKELMHTIFNPKMFVVLEESKLK